MENFYTYIIRDLQNLSHLSFFSGHKNVSRREPGVAGTLKLLSLEMLVMVRMVRMVMVRMVRMVMVMGRMVMVMLAMVLLMVIVVVITFWNPKLLRTPSISRHILWISTN